MNNDMSSSTQPDRLNQMMDVLLAENAFLKQVVAALLPNGKGLSQIELAFVKTITVNYESESSNQQVQNGNNETGISNQQPQNGNNAMKVSNQQVYNGNNETGIFNQKVMSGNNVMNNSIDQPQEGSYEQQLAIVKENVRNLMKTAILSSHLTTSKIIIQLSRNPATPLSDLRKLTGLSEDGMSKRIMAMKKAGLIVKLSAPKRFLLTEKAKTLFIKIWR